MAIRCSQCGHELPREDARFCSYCGHYNQPVQPQSRPAAPPASRVTQDAPAAQESRDSQAGQRTPASQPSSQPSGRRPDANATPWFGLDGQQGLNATPWLGIDGYPAPEAPRTPAVQRDAHVPETPRTPAVQRDIPARPDPSAPLAGQRPKMRKFSPSLNDGSASRPHVDAQAHAEKPTASTIDVEDMPTTNMQVEPGLRQGAYPAPTNPRSEGGLQQAQSAYPSVPQTPASPPSTPPPHQPPMTPAPPVTPYSDRGPSRPFPGQAQQMQQLPSTPVPPTYQPTGAPAQQGQPFERSAPVAPSAVKPTTTRGQRKPRLLLFALVALIVVVLVAGGAWALLTNPFSVPAETQPTQTITNNTLGVTLSDPAGWQQHSAGSTWTLQDSSGTAQMVLTQAAGSDPTTILSQQAHTLGMTNAKVEAPVTFAGTSWSAIHGDYQNQGANYTGTIYATVHNGHLYILSQMAPKVTFSDEERLVFAPTRSSLQWK